MKHRFLLSALFLISLLFSGCRAPRDPLTAYHAANGTLGNPNFLSYSFEHPSSWKMEEGVNHISLASEKRLLQDVPEKLEPGQIIVGLSRNTDMSPAEMLETSASRLKNIVQFDEPIAFPVNRREAVHQTGTLRESQDVLFTLAVDMGENQRGLLSPSIAQGELEKWKEVLFKIAESLQVDRERKRANFTKHWISEQGITHAQKDHE